MTRPTALAIFILALAPLLPSCKDQPQPPAAPRDAAVGDKTRHGAIGGGAVLVTTQQLIRPAGQSVEFGGRPVDLAPSADGQTLYVKDKSGLLVLEAKTLKIRQQLNFPGNEGASLCGIVLDERPQPATSSTAAPAARARVYLTSSGGKLHQADVDAAGKAKWVRAIDFKTGGVTTKPTTAAASRAATPPPTTAATPKPSTAPITAAAAPNPYPCGLALASDGRRAFVALSIANALGVVDLVNGKVEAQIPLGVAPYGVALSKDNTLAYVSNWGGRRAKKGEHTAKSAKTDTLVDERGVASSGTVSVVDLKSRKELAQIAVGLHPADLKLNADGSRLYVANANSDTVSVIDTVARAVVETILVRPDPTLPFGSASNALALSPDGKRLFVANGGNNAIAVVRLGDAGNPSSVEGFIPTAWYPGAVATNGHDLFVANVKGLGSRKAKPNQKAWAVQQYLGTVTKVAIPADAAILAAYTRQVQSDSRVPQTLAAMEKAQSGVKPVPVPARVGEPSVFDHVVYVIKENRTYDQVLGDLGKGNSDPRFCIFGKTITPNLHKLADEFVLLDNFYCNGVISADGHAWATEGLAVDYLEKSFGGWVRSYPFGGDDPLAVASTGFIWDGVLLAGKSFRNYGEMENTKITTPKAGFREVFRDWQTHAGKVALRQEFPVEHLQRYSCESYPGWNLNVPDQLRLDVFLKEFEEAKRTGEWPSFLIVYLPQDHTSGTGEGNPTPAAMAADNDLAVGRLIEAISHSRFWPTTAVFVIEDDPQDGVDHVDGHRSPCYVASPYTKRNTIVSRFYNQTSVLHTMELILGIPPMNQMDAMAPVMTDCFNDTLDIRPYAAVKNLVPLDQMNPKKATLPPKAKALAELSERQDLTLPDKVDDDAMNRILWHAMRGIDTRFPAEFAGAHGKGLKALHLKPNDDDDDDR